MSNELNQDIEEIQIYLNHIKQVCPELTAEELAEFGTKLSVTYLAKNDIYIASGQIQNQGGYLVKGLIRAFHTDDFANEKNIYFIPENEYTFHYASFMDKKPSPLTFQCLEPSVVVNFPMEHLHTAYTQIPKLEKYGRLIVESKLKIQQERLESLLFQNAEQRYLDFIDMHPQLFTRINISQLCSYGSVRFIRGRFCREQFTHAQSNTDDRRIFCNHRIGVGIVELETE